MMFGRYWFSQNIYEFNGHHLTPRYNADPYKFNIIEVQQVLESAYEATPKGQKGILIVTLKKWEEIKKHFGSWIGLAQFHYVDHTINAGGVPDWLKDADSYNGCLIHEYADGKVVYRGDPELIYKYFKDSPAPIVEPVVPPNPTPPQEDAVGIPTWLWIVVSSMSAIIGLLLGMIIKS